jgi:hypothetical protein
LFNATNEKVKLKIKADELTIQRKSVINGQSILFLGEFLGDNTLLFIFSYLLFITFWHSYKLMNPFLRPYFFTIALATF